MTLLVEEARILTHPHLRGIQTDDGLTTGTEPPLLDLLQEAVSATTTSKSSGGSGGRPVPIDLGALSIWQEITETIDTNWPGAGDPQAFERVPHKLKLNAWVNRTLTPVQEAGLLDLVRGWVLQIRELLEPTRKVPIPGWSCPICNWDHTITTDEDGHTTRHPALVRYPDAEPTRVVCTVETCDGYWEGPEITDTFFMQTG